MEYFLETNQIYGMIKGKSYRRKSRKFDYDKLVKKITKVQQCIILIDEIAVKTRVVTRFNFFVFRKRSVA